MNEIEFFTEDLEFELNDKSKIIDWILSIVQSENKQISSVNYIFCSDEYLLTINQEYLDHDYYTDIITFQHNEPEEPISSDIFISIERVRENSNHLNISFDQELLRVIIHGILHLMGYSDKTDNDKNSMRSKEDACISLFYK